eukprot:scaffold34413_cov174-Isochrysis_galbana.AAC.1
MEVKTGSRARTPRPGGCTAHTSTKDWEANLLCQPAYEPAEPPAWGKRSRRRRGRSRRFWQTRSGALSGGSASASDVGEICAEGIWTFAVVGGIG